MIGTNITDIAFSPIHKNGGLLGVCSEGHEVLLYDINQKYYRLEDDGSSSVMGLFRNRKQLGEKSRCKFILDSTSKRKKAGFAFIDGTLYLVVITMDGKYFSMPIRSGEGELNATMVQAQDSFMKVQQQDIQI